MRVSAIFPEFPRRRATSLLPQKELPWGPLAVLGFLLAGLRSSF
jgi:hypothetical protein